MNMYVLIESYEGDRVLGVFDHVNITEDTLKNYYGESCKVVQHKDIQDSGLEWSREISHIENGEVVTDYIYLLEFEVNEL